MPETAFANCQPSDRQHGGTAFIARLVGMWHVTGQAERRRFDGRATGSIDKGVLTLVFHPTESGVQSGTPSLSLRYDARCDDFVAVRDSWFADGTLRTATGRGVARGDALDDVFPASPGGRRTDIALEMNEGRTVLRLRMARERAEGQWEPYGTLLLERAGSAVSFGRLQMAT
jgi:hypothetical protein